MLSLLRPLIALALLAALVPPAAAQATFSNTTPITIPSSGTASPYPSTINVAGLTGTITKITVTLTGFNHTFPDDVAMLFTGPGNSHPVLLADGPGDGTDATNLTWTFSDSGAATLPSTGALTSGTFRPGLNEYGSVLSAPAPSTGYATNFSAFNGATPNGIYSLFIQDFNNGDGGSVTGGWSISILTNTMIPEPGTLTLLGLGLMGGIAGRRRK